MPVTVYRVGHASLLGGLGVAYLTAAGVYWNSDRQPDAKLMADCQGMRVYLFVVRSLLMSA